MAQHGRSCSTCEFWQNPHKGPEHRDGYLWGICFAIPPSPGRKETPSGEWCGQYERDLSKKCKNCINWHPYNDPRRLRGRFSGHCNAKTEERLPAACCPQWTLKITEPSHVS